MSTTATSGDAPRTTTGDADSDPQRQDTASPPSAWRQIFASVLTPNWSLGLLLFVCLTLPSYRGCNNDVIIVGQVFLEVEPTADSIYMVFLVTWPYLFGLLVAGGTLWMAATGDPRKASVLWRCFAGLILLNAALLVVAALTSYAASTEPVDVGSEFLAAWWLIVPAVVALGLLPLTARLCRDPFHAAMWLQGGLAFLAALSVSILTPGLLMADEFLFGGKLAIACSVLLIVGTIVERLDGRRALLRRSDESPLQLSLRAMLVLMLIGGVACSWIGTFVFAEIPAQ